MNHMMAQRHVYYNVCITDNYVSGWRTQKFVSGTRLIVYAVFNLIFLTIYDKGSMLHIKHAHNLHMLYIESHHEHVSI